MGFMDKAKKMAEQAQAKLDQAQQQFNSGQSSSAPPAGAGVEYDQHGRPIAEEPADVVVPPHGDPLASSEPVTTAAPDEPTTAFPVTEGPPPTPGVPPTADADPAEDRNHPSYAPPKLSDGDPLAG